MTLPRTSVPCWSIWNSLLAHSRGSMGASVETPTGDSGSCTVTLSFTTPPPASRDTICSLSCPRRCRADTAGGKEPWTWPRGGNGRRLERISHRRVKWGAPGAADRWCPESVCLVCDQEEVPAAGRDIHSGRRETRVEATHVRERDRGAVGLTDGSADRRGGLLLRNNVMASQCCPPLTGLYPSGNTQPEPGAQGHPYRSKRDAGRAPPACHAIPARTCENHQKGERTRPESSTQISSAGE